MEKKLEFRYVVVLNDGDNKLKANAGFNDIRDAMEHADMKAALHVECDHDDALFLAYTGRIAHYEVIDTREAVDGWESKYKTASFFND